MAQSNVMENMTSPCTREPLLCPDGRCGPVARRPKTAAMTASYFPRILYSRCFVRISGAPAESLEVCRAKLSAYNRRTCYRLMGM